MKGLVLEGGGTKGAYQIGAYKALRELGIEFKGVAGTSIGALNGAYIVQDNIEVLEDIWTNYDYTHFMNVDEETYHSIKNIDFTPKNLNMVISLINKARKNQGIDISPFRNLLEKTINEDLIRNSNKDFGLVTVMWDGKIVPNPMFIENIPKGKLLDYLIASASLPIFKLDKLDDKLFLDGVFHNNIPVSLLREKGYEDIVVIRLIDDLFGKVNLNHHKDMNMKVIVPSEYLGGCLNVDPDNVHKNIKLGYMDAMKTFNRYDGIRYYFNLDYKYDDEYCFDKLSNLSKDSIESLCKLLNIKRDINKRTLLEAIIPKLGESLNLSKEFSYKDLFYCIYEKKLEENNINRLNLYDFNKVVEVVNTNINSNMSWESNFEVRPIISIHRNRFTKLLTNIIINDIKTQT
ncbi:MAG: patatin-like phospholipase family protein [Paeniclostridium sordellii]|uniref:Patatin-like phospholipase family protein n=1 Tax=Paeniclostridium hominis TaxID=2764329 RepID=A0ABR7K4M9_9FIRM|nr:MULTISPECIES: patatin-like phospholipase family protein [Paeniclostridium]MBC6004061.1 patatin-like phospholipase family protein [Paeniclostridium hominis]MDU2591757.1 patatin-like phospholipase family protein [Paeniclostridium sordellii]